MGDEIFDEEIDAQAASLDESPENTIFTIRPSERQALDRWVLTGKASWRGLNGSMVVRCLLRIFAQLQVETEGVRSEVHLEDQIKRAIASMDIRS